MPVALRYGWLIRFRIQVQFMWHFFFVDVSSDAIDRILRVVGRRFPVLIICWRLWSIFIIGWTCSGGWGAYDAIYCNCLKQLATLFLRNGTGGFIHCGAERWLVEMDTTLFCESWCFAYITILVLFILPCELRIWPSPIARSKLQHACMSLRIFFGNVTTSSAMGSSIEACSNDNPEEWQVSTKLYYDVFVLIWFEEL